MKIRTATHSDIHAIESLIRENPDTLLNRNDGEIERLIDSFYVAEEQGMILGCCCLEVYSPKIAEIRSVAVKKEARNQGIGSQLVSQAIADANNKNILEIMVVTSNLQFFEQLQFGPCLNEKYALFWSGKKKG